MNRTQLKTQASKYVTMQYMIEVAFQFNGYKVAYSINGFMIDYTSKKSTSDPYIIICIETNAKGFTGLNGNINHAKKSLKKLQVHMFIILELDWLFSPGWCGSVD